MAWIDYKKAYDTVPHNWIINGLKVFKISHEVMNFIEKTVKTWRMGLIARGKSLTETNIQRRIFQGDALSPSLFIIAMMPGNYIPRKCMAGHKLSGSQEKTNHLMYMDDIKVFATNEKKLETLIPTVRIYSQDIGMEFGLEKYVMLVMKSGKRHMADGMELSNHDKIRTLGESETYEYLTDTIKNGNERQDSKRISQENLKTRRGKTLQ